MFDSGAQHAGCLWRCCPGIPCVARHRAGFVHGLLETAIAGLRVGGFSRDRRWGFQSGGVEFDRGVVLVDDSVWDDVARSLGVRGAGITELNVSAPRGVNSSTFASCTRLRCFEVTETDHHVEFFTAVVDEGISSESWTVAMLYNGDRLCPQRSSAKRGQDILVRRIGAETVEPRASGGIASDTSSSASRSRQRATVDWGELDGCFALCPQACK